MTPEEPVVVTALRACSTWDALYKNLPDWELPSLPCLTFALPHSGSSGATER
jgi:hypothetical protein